MNLNVFMSYSRREVGFVDDLTSRLEKAGIPVWLDYRNLIPGTSWETQINKGLDEAQVIVLVVSKASLASQYVELEWRRVLSHTDKRIILAIFEAVDLPAELEKFEWVDFRGNYKAGVKELIEQIKSPVQEKHPAPETGFKIPAAVWWSATLGAVAGFCSLFAFWTVLLPLVLVPLPFRVLRRDFNFSHVQTSLWLLPFGVLISGINIPPDDAMYGVFLITLNVSFLTAIALLLILRLPAMQRWGKPEATVPRFSNPFRPRTPNPKPVSYFIDYSPSDQRIARRLAKTLAKYNHRQAADIQSAEAVFVLLSCYKTDTEADPENQCVFPVLIQTMEPSPKLSKVQWIDFRRGIRNLDAIAQLLPEPARLLSALGVRPTGNQLVLPPIISAMTYLLIILLAFMAGSFVGDTVAFFASSARGGGSLFLKIVCLGISIWLGTRMIVALRERRGRFASVLGAVGGYLALGVLIILMLVSTTNSDAFYIPLGNFNFFIYGVGGVVLTLYALTLGREDYFNWLPWLPSKHPNKASA